MDVAFVISLTGWVAKVLSDLAMCVLAIAAVVAVMKMRK